MQITTPEWLQQKLSVMKISCFKVDDLFSRVGHLL